MQSVNSAACGECSVRVQCVRVQCVRMQCVRVQCVRVQCGGYSVEGTV